MEGRWKAVEASRLLLVIELDEEREHIAESHVTAVAREAEIEADTHHPAARGSGEAERLRQLPNQLGQVKGWNLCLGGRVEIGPSVLELEKRGGRGGEGETGREGEGRRASGGTLKSSMSFRETRSVLALPSEVKFSRMTATTRLRITDEQRNWKETKKGMAMVEPCVSSRRASFIREAQPSPVRH